MTYEEQKDPELFRKSQWNFPRGLGNGDSAEETAKNEILEEIGGKGSLIYALCGHSVSVKALAAPFLLYGKHSFEYNEMYL